MKNDTTLLVTILLITGGATLLFLLGQLTTFSGIENDCQSMGMTRINDAVYSCEKRE